MDTYYLGVIWSKGYYQLQAAESVDCLSCEINAYLGARVTSKRDLRSKKASIIKLFNERFNKNFTRLTVI